MERFQVSRTHRVKQPPRGLRWVFAGFFLKERGGHAQSVPLARAKPNSLSAYNLLNKVACADVWNGAGILLLFLLLYAGRQLHFVICSLLLDGIFLTI